MIRTLYKVLKELIKCLKVFYFSKEKHSNTRNEHEFQPRMLSTPALCLSASVPA